ncbi:MAG: hypothetical protein BIFFINMI_00702 [Phycisphaerae bacterium]|nr:hypothetical protein [Phycisphaerae bacterium]
MKGQIEREEDDRWIAEVPELPGVMSYGCTRKQALAKAKALVLRVLADRLDPGQDRPPHGPVSARPVTPLRIAETLSGPLHLTDKGLCL